MKRRLGLWVIAFVLLAVPVSASLNSAIEQTIQGWFDAAGHFVRFKLYSSTTPALSTTGNSVWYYDTVDACVKVSSNGGAFVCIAGTGTVASGCTFNGTTLTCPAFDSPADANNGGCWTLYEAITNGSNIVKLCAAANLTGDYVLTTNADGTLKGEDIETSNAQNLGRVLRYNLTTGVQETKPAATVVSLPDGDGLVAATETEVQGGNNEMRCVVFTARDTIINATRQVFEVSTAAGTCGACLYPDADAGVLLSPMIATSPGVGVDCSGAGAKSKTGLDAFSVQEGSKYRLCWTASGTSAKLRGGTTRVSALTNALSVTSGTAANAGVAGVCPTTTGVITGATVITPVVVLGP